MFLAALFWPSELHAQFQAAEVGLPDVEEGALAWGDYDRDGYLDLLLTGRVSPERIARVYRNVDGTGRFQEVSDLDLELWKSSVAWGDYDRDGYPDILLIGRVSHPHPDSARVSVAKVYRNVDGSGRFEEVADLPGVDNGAARWGDYDNDGDLDFVVAGIPNAARLYENDGGTFQEAPLANALLEGGRGSSVAWGDYDNDQDLDLLVAGEDPAAARIYRNEGAGAFVDAGITLEYLGGPVNSALGSVAWGDYDNDGDLDMLLAGASGSPDLGSISAVFENLENGTRFEEANTFTGIRDGFGAWGDYDNDGDQDVLLAGRTDSEASVARIYTNTAGGFDTATPVGLEGGGGVLGAGAWGDYDNDGDLDLFLAGKDTSGTAGQPLSRLFENVLAATPNEPPGPPANLRAATTPEAVTFAWDPAADAETPSPGLTYNLRVGTAPGASDVVAPMALESGQRLIPAPGNVHHNVRWVLRGLEAGIYYWSVQAIDAALAGGAFADEGSFELRDLPPGAPTPQEPAAGAIGMATTPTLRWNAVPGTGSYVVQVSTDEAFANPVVEATTGDTSYTVAPGDELEPGISYFWRVQAGGLQGENLLSEAARFTTYPEEMALDLPEFTFGSVGETTNYRLLGLPAVEGLPVADAFAGEAGEAWEAYYDTGQPGDDPADYLIAYSESDPADPRFRFAPGRGFWFISNQSWVLPERTVPAVPLNDAGAYPVPLNGEGSWTILSNPFDVPVCWGSVRAANGLPESAVLYGYEEGAYPEVRVLQPYEGYYVFNAEGLEALAIPYDTPAGRGSACPSGDELAASRHVLTLTVHQQGATRAAAHIATARVAVLPDAEAALDAHDRLAPPGGFEALRLAWHNEHLGSAYTWLRQEARPATRTGHAFDLVLQAASEGPKTLRVSGLEHVARYEVYLVDPAGGPFIDLRATPEVALEARAGMQRFRLLVGSKAFVAGERDTATPEDVTLDPNHPNPFSQSTTIAYTLPEAHGPVDIELAVYNVLGQRVGTLVEARQAPGRYRLTWDGHDAAGLPLASGVYLYRLQVGTTVRTRRMLLVR